jgi:hypothetical protein
VEVKVMRALKMVDVGNCFDNNPIKLEDLDKYYVNADAGRGLTPMKKMKRTLEQNPNGNYKFLLAGYKGCGKSTELVRMQRDLLGDFVILNLSVRHELDINNINYIELFIVIMKRLFQFVNEEKRIKIAKEYLDNITHWLKSEEIVEINDKYMGMGIEAGMEAKGGIPFLANFFAKFTASAKTSSSLKGVLKRTIEPKLSELIFHCNALIQEVGSKLNDIGKKGLLIIVEDMDKVDLSLGENIFYAHSSQLIQLNANIVFTFPIALKYYHRFTTIKKIYSGSFDLPMIRVKNPDGTKFEAGYQLMREIIRHRMELDLFENPGILDNIIMYSGGCLFDMFQMIKDAADNALDFEREKITDTDYKVAYLFLKSGYENTISDNREGGISVDDYYRVLVQCATDKNKKPKQTRELLDLRNNLTVLGYNGENWSDVHPVVRDILIERGKIKG